MSQIEFSFQRCSKLYNLTIKGFFFFFLKSNFHVGVSPIPQLIHVNHSLWIPVYLGVQAWIHV